MYILIMVKGGLSRVVKIKINGTLKDRDTFQPLGNRRIIIQINGDEYTGEFITITNSDGTFELEDLIVPGMYKIIARFEGDKIYNMCYTTVDLDARLPSEFYIYWYGWYEQGVFYIVICGSLYNYYYEPIIGAKVDVVLGDLYNQVTTDEFGGFYALFVVPAGKYYALATYNGDNKHKPTISHSIFIDTDTMPI